MIKERIEDEKVEDKNSNVEDIVEIKDTFKNGEEKPKTI